MVVVLIQGEQGISMMDNVPFLDPDIILALNKVFLLSTLFFTLVIIFFAFICLKVDKRVEWSWISVFVPSYLALGMLVGGLVWMALKDDEEDEDSTEEEPDVGFHENREDGERAKKRKKKAKKMESLLAKTYTIAYFGLLLIFDVLVSLKLENVITASWWAVVVPWFLVEVYHFITGCVILFMKFKEGVYVTAPYAFVGEDQPQYIQRPLNVAEKFWAVVDTFIDFGLRITFAILLVYKITSWTELSWV
jgi:energy-coupling factor transporter transmembrane protein EcfT